MPAMLPATLIIFRHCPYGTSWTAEGLDIALLSASFGAQVALYFCDDGVFNLMAGQQRSHLGQKGTLNTLQALEMYDIDHLYVDGASLVSRGVNTEALALNVEDKSLVDLLADYPRVFNF